MKAMLIKLALDLAYSSEMKKPALVIEPIWLDIESLLSRKTSRSRTTLEGWIEQVSSSWRQRDFKSRCGLDRRSNHINSVFFVFSFRRMDAHQDCRPI